VLPEPPDRREGPDSLAWPLGASKLGPDLSLLPLEIIHDLPDQDRVDPGGDAAQLRMLLGLDTGQPRLEPCPSPEGLLATTPQEGVLLAFQGRPPGGPDGAAPVPGLRRPRSGVGRPGCAPCSSGTPSTRRTPWSGEPFGPQPSGGCSGRRPSLGGAGRRRCPGHRPPDQWAGVLVAGVALIVLVLRMLVAQAVARDAEGPTCRPSWTR
jgi:hypothetical protein